MNYGDRMKRRSFLRNLCGWVAAVPIFGAVAWRIGPRPSNEQVDEFREIIAYWREVGCFGNAPECKRCEFIRIDTADVAAAIRKMRPEFQAAGLRVSAQYFDRMDGQKRVLVIVDGNTQF
jgi:hypothetical protein